MTPSNKPGVQTSEFWLTLLSLVATISHALGFTGGVAGDVKTTVSGATLALITAWFGSNYMSGRLQLKGNWVTLADEIRRRVVDVPQPPAERPAGQPATDAKTD